ncbi:MAG: hypothetical protein JWM10_3154 [Myxococcaceae bacterium]|nr:hypothetical protein [Myxococcaceae bacterium]
MAKSQESQSSTKASPAYAFAPATAGVLPSSPPPTPPAHGEELTDLSDLDTQMGVFLQREPPPPDVLKVALPELLEMVEPRERARLVSSYLDHASNFETYRLWFGGVALVILAAVTLVALASGAAIIAGSALTACAGLVGAILYTRLGRHR